jgi:hypothetical protein
VWTPILCTTTTTTTLWTIDIARGRLVIVVVVVMMGSCCGGVRGGDGRFWRYAIGVSVSVPCGMVVVLLLLQCGRMVWMPPPIEESGIVQRFGQHW